MYIDSIYVRLDVSLHSAQASERALELRTVDMWMLLITSAQEFLAFYSGLCYYRLWIKFVHISYEQRSEQQEIKLIIWARFTSINKQFFFYSENRVLPV